MNNNSVQPNLCYYVPQTKQQTCESNSEMTLKFILDKLLPFEQRLLALEESFTEVKYSRAAKIVELMEINNSQQSKIFELETTNNFLQSKIVKLMEESNYIQLQNMYIRNPNDQSRSSVNGSIISTVPEKEPEPDSRPKRQKLNQSNSEIIEHIEANSDTEIDLTKGSSRCPIELDEDDTSKNNPPHISADIPMEQITSTQQIDVNNDNNITSIEDYNGFNLRKFNIITSVNITTSTPPAGSLEPSYVTYDINETELVQIS